MDNNELIKLTTFLSFDKAKQFKDFAQERGLECWLENLKSNQVEVYIAKVDTPIADMILGDFEDDETVRVNNPESSLVDLIKVTWDTELIPYKMVLDEAGIRYFMADNIYASIAPFESNALGGIKLKVRKEDLPEAVQLVKQVNEQKENPSQEIKEVAYNEEHYLNDYSLKELEEIVIEYDKWSTDDVSYAYTLLKTKGSSISREDINAERDKRLKELSKPKVGNIWWLYFGYFLALSGGFLSIFFIVLAPLIGWNFYVLKKTLPNGKKVFVYDENTRKKGKTLLVVSLIAIPTWLIVFIFFKEYLFNILLF